MFDLKVCGYSELKNLIEVFQPTYIVSLIEEIESFGGHHLHIHVSDIHMPKDGYIFPSIDHLKQILAFTRKFNDNDRIIVHCWAGQSRSTAIAIAILLQHGMSCDDAFNYVKTIRPILLPNREFIRLIDEYFFLNDELTTLIDNHSQSRLTHNTKKV